MQLPSAPAGFELYDNVLQFRNLDGGQIDGVKLSDDEKEYLLPHFLMLLVGKPGSGKTTLLKQLITNPQMYFRKFDDVFLVSPSHAKMGIKIKQENATSSFSLDWLFEKFATINDEQLEQIFGFRGTRSKKGTKSETDRQTLSTGLLLKDERSRFLLSDAFASATLGGVAGNPAGKAAATANMIDPQVEMQKKYEDLKRLPRQDQERTHRNVLVVLDDVVASIKKAEFDPRLAQLVMNRRHIIFNGTISLIMVTQKYNLIPARVRSNANWLILYQLNPLDFELAYRDCVTLPPYRWREVLKFVYGVDVGLREPARDRSGYKKQKEEVPVKGEIEEEEKKQPAATEKRPRIEDEIKGKKFENLGIWVESNMYFKNFKRINFNNQ